jgi:4-amino-4-deoxy-L-arabinose transferase-like glycosyltransferase
MSAPNLPQWLIRFAIAVALPSIACFGLYSLDHVAEDNSSWTVPVILAYPAALIGLGGLAMAVLAPRRSNVKIWWWAIGVAIPVMFLLVVRA